MRQSTGIYQRIKETDSIEIYWLLCLSKLDCSMSISRNHELYYLGVCLRLLWRQQIPTPVLAIKYYSRALIE